MPRLHSWLGFDGDVGIAVWESLELEQQDVILYASIQVFFFFFDRTVVIGSFASGCAFHPLGQNDTLPDF